MYYILNIIRLVFLLFIISAPSLTQAKNIKNSAVVFMYHRFDASQYPSTNITLDQLNSHLLELTSSKYNIKSLDFIIDTIINDGNLSNNTIGISVDDAHRSFLTKGWPLFKKFEIPVTLFVSTSTISDTNNNYLSWDEIRKMKDEGLVIGSHSHRHDHLSKKNIDQLREEIETSNRIFLKELGQIPTLFAYPYGETSEKFFNLLDSYNFKVAFGQHSGVINETSNFYYMPRFALNEQYGEIDRVKFAANSKGMGVYDFVPKNPVIIDNPPYIGFSLLDQSLSKNLNCFVFDRDGQVENEMFKFNERIEIRLNRKLNIGRTRMNCTAKDQDGNWRWFGHQFTY